MEKQNNVSNNKRIAKNSIALYIRMMLQTVIGLYTSRVILNALGINDFGIYNVVGSIVGMFNFINTSMSNATMRFITFEEEKGNLSKLNTVFCTSMNIHIIIAVLTFFFLNTAGVWFLYNKIIISPDRLNAAFWVLQFSILTCIVNIVSVPYNACIIAHEKMGAFAFISILQQVAILGLALFLPFYTGDRLIMYAVILMSVQIIIRIIYGQYCRRNFQEAIYRFIWDKKTIKEMSKFAGWTMNGNIAWIGYTQGLNILVNMFCGSAVNAARGIAFTVQQKIMEFSNNFQVAVAPQITKTYSIEDFDKMHGLVIMSSKFSFYLMLVIALPIFIEIDEILKLWLKLVPEHTANFVRLILCCSVIDIFKNPMNISIHATGNIKKFQLWEATTLLLIVPLAYVALRLGFMVESVFVVQLIVFIIVQCERVFIVCPRINMAKTKYVRELLFPSFKVLMLSLILPVILLFLWPIQKNNLVQLLLYLFIVFLSTALTVYFAGLSRAEQLNVRHFLKSRLKQHILCA